MSNKNNFQKKANALFEQYPAEKKVIITENGQCFFDENAAKNYHDLKGFDSDPETFFREGFEDEDDSDLEEAFENAKMAKLELTAIVEEIGIVADLEQTYDPATADTDETLTSVIALREKYEATNQMLIEANIEIERLSSVSSENEDLKTQLEAANQQIELLNKPAKSK